MTVPSMAPRIDARHSGWLGARCRAEHEIDMQTPGRACPRRSLLGPWLAAGLVLAGGLAGGREMDTDLLVVGGNESACAAAVQAARLGVRRIALVNDNDFDIDATGNAAADPAGRRTCLWILSLPSSGR